MRTEALPHHGLRVEGAGYAMDLNVADGSAFLRIRHSHQRHVMFLGGACNPVGKRDESVSFGRPRVRRSAGVLTVRLPVKSSAWRKKTCVFVFRRDSIEVFHEIEGKGAIDRVHYFRGYRAGQELGMAGDIDEIYNTCPNFQEKRYVHPGESFNIAAGNNLEMPVGCQACASPCFCMGLHDRRDRLFLSAGLLAAPGQYAWDAFEWNSPVAIPVTPFGPDNALAGGFAAVYAGKLSVDGRWETPRLVLAVARSEEDVLAVHLRHAYRHGYLQRPPRRAPVRWWLEPIYCTWHDQVALAHAATDRDGIGVGQNAFDFCRQDLVDRWINLLERHGCKPGTVILDAGWTAHSHAADADTAKWPNMRAWIDACHDRGIRVMLWTAAWSATGLPKDECILRDGKPIAGDVTNPKYVRRLRELLRRWFSDAEGCLNADGVKIDGLLGLPAGNALRSRGGVWGLELQRLYLKTFYEEAKKHKPDVCISTFVANPYLAPFTDMQRVGDMYTCRLTAHETLLHRAALQRAVTPFAVIDTDGQFSHYYLDGYASEVAEQAKVGVPTIYCADKVYRQRFFQPTRIAAMTAEDYRTIARAFADYRKTLRPSGRRRR